MTVPQSNPQIGDELDALTRDMSAALDAGLRASPPAARPSPGGLRQAGGGGRLWGPTTPPVTSPLMLLMKAADDAQALLALVGQLVADITGEAPVTPRQRAVPRAGGGLLPGIGHLAHEIEVTLAEVDRKLRELGSKLG